MSQVSGMRAALRRVILGCIGAALWASALRAQPLPEAAYEPPVSPRVVHTLTRDWTFAYFPDPKPDTSLAAPGFDDGAWEAVALPHTWSTYETTGEVHPFIRSAAERDDPYWWQGWGWYRKRFTLDPSLRGRPLSVEFDGVQKYSRVYVNGRFAGEQRGGYNSFSFDITPYVRWDGENVLAVQVSNRRDDLFGGIPPMTAGNFDVYGGIYRDVRLVARRPVHVPYQGSPEREGGTFVTTPRADSAGGVVRVVTHVRNAGAAPAEVRLRTVVVDAAGRTVVVVEDAARLSAGAAHAFRQESGLIERPRLWSPEDPYLYRVHTEVWADGRLSDTYQSPLGFRAFRWDAAENALYLNGRRVRIRGTNRHQEYPWLGDALPKWMHEADLQDIRFNMGHNFLRATHYPNDPVLYDLTDRFGIITVEEVPNIKSLDFGEDIQEANARAMVRRDRNHPSIFFWSVGNETNDPADARWVHEEDSTRIIHLRHGPAGDPYVTHTDKQLELENQLRVTIRGWYDRDERDAQPENGQHAGTETWQHQRMRTRDGDRARIDEDLVHWLYADHGADREYVGAPLKHVNQKGWVDLYRVPKYGYWLWRANYSPQPSLFVHPHFWRAAYAGQRRDIVVDANTAWVELRVNGRLVGRQTPADSNFHTVTFREVLVEPGVLEATGPFKGETARHAVAMAGAPARLTLTVSHDTLTADRAGVAVVMADIVDAAGVHVYGAQHPIVWSVEGPGRLVGPAAYTTDAHKNGAMEGVHYIDAPVANVVRSTAAPGVIVVRVAAPGLAPAEARIRSVAPPVVAGPVVEPPLAEEGRRRTRRDPAYRPRLEAPTAPGIAPLTEPLQLAAPDSAGRRAELRRQVAAWNPAVDTAGVAFRLLLDRLTASAARTEGHFIEDDYNFIAGKYHGAAVLVRLAEELPVAGPFKKALAEYYAVQVIARDAPIDAAAEAAKLSPLLGGAVVAVPGAAGPPSAVANHTGGYLDVQAADLGQLFALVYPDWTDLSDAERRRVFALIDALNPYVTLSGGRYLLMPGRPVALPLRPALEAAARGDR